MRKILVIEDEPEMRRNISTLLRFHDYEPIEAENGRKGLELAQRGNPDLVLCDVMMPELDGHGVLQALQQDADLALQPLLKLGLTPRATETLLWLAQGETNPNIATILGITESTVKKHVQEIFEKLGVETRGAATVRALEVLNSVPQ